MAQGMSSGLSDLVQASRAVAATSGDPMRVLTATEEALERCWTLLRESGSLLSSTVGPEERDVALEPLEEESKNLSSESKVRFLGQREVEEAIQSITSTSLTLEKFGSKSIWKELCVSIMPVVHV